MNQPGMGKVSDEVEAAFDIYGVKGDYAAGFLVKEVFVAEKATAYTPPAQAIEFARPRDTTIPHRQFLVELARRVYGDNRHDPELTLVIWPRSEEETETS